MLFNEVMNLIDMLSEVDNIVLIHAFNPKESRPEYFIKYIQKYSKTTYRSPYWINFDRFRPFKYFIVLFAEAGSGGEIPAWGLCERQNCKRVRHRSESDAFMEAEYGFPGEEGYEFKSLFYFREIGLFSSYHNCSEFTLIKTKKPIADLRLLRTALYAEIPDEVLNEIRTHLEDKS